MPWPPGPWRRSPAPPRRSTIPCGSDFPALSPGAGATITVLLAMPARTGGRCGRYVWALAACVLLALAAGLRSDEPLDRLTIVAPAAPGGGWDLTAHAMADVLQGAGIVRRVD